MKRGKLEDYVAFPITIYKKYNGYLGLLGVDAQTNNLVFTSKSVINGEFANWFEEIFYKNYSGIIDKLKEFLVNNKLSLTFEVIAHQKDPHIIEYNKDFVVLLDAFSTEDLNKKLSFDDLIKLSHNFNFEVKEQIQIIDNYQELKDFIHSTSKHMDLEIEGFVAECSNGFMFKIKTGYYSFWKHMRSVADSVSHGRPVKLGALTTPLANNFYGFLVNKGRDWLKNKDIISLRKEFEQQA